MTAAMTSGVAAVEGADLYFEWRGAGPPLLLIAGGGGDCGVFEPLADALAGTYTVISYDRRGNSRSPLRRPPAVISVADQSADAVAVIHTNGFDSALIFGSSGGATIAIDLAARHPRLVSAVVPHEPPVPKALADAADILARYDEIERIRKATGWQAAFTRFLTENGLAPDQPELLAVMLDPARLIPAGPTLDDLRRENGNWAYMMEYEVAPFIAYEPDWAGLAASSAAIALGAGAETRDQVPHRASAAIAERLGVPLVIFTGGHTAPAALAGVFATELRTLLQRLVATSAQ